MDDALASNPLARSPRVLQIGGFELDLARGELRSPDGQPAELRRQALDVLLLLGTQAGHVVSKSELLDRVWPGVVVTEDSLVQAVADIRRVLGDGAHRRIRTVSRRGYLLVVDTPAADADHPKATNDAAHIAPSAGTVPWRPSLPNRRWQAALLVMALATTALFVWTSARRTTGGDALSASASSPPPRIAIMAFRDRDATGDRADLGYGLSEDIVAELARNQGLPVVSHHSSFALSGKGLGSAELGRQLGARYLVDGSLQRDGESLRIQAELIDAQAEKVVWTERQQVEGGAVVAARDRIVARIAGTLWSKVRESEKQRALAQAPKSLDVYAMTQRGLALKHQFTPAATREARAGLECALATDPNYAPAWYVMGWVNAVDIALQLTGEWGTSRAGDAVAQINRSIELDPFNPAAYTALGVAHFQARQFNAAVAATQRAVELGPGDADAHLFHGWFLMATDVAEQGLSEVQLALAINPVAPVYFQGTKAKVLWANDRAVEAGQEARDCLRKAPLIADCRIVAMLAQTQGGNLSEARDHASALSLRGITAQHACVVFGLSDAAKRCLAQARLAGLPD